MLNRRTALGGAAALGELGTHMHRSPRRVAHRVGHEVDHHLRQARRVALQGVGKALDGEVERQALVARVVGDLAAQVSPRFVATGTVVAGLFAGGFASRLSWTIDDVAGSASAIDRQQVTHCISVFDPSQATQRFRRATERLLQSHSIQLLHQQVRAVPDKFSGRAFCRRRRHVTVLQATKHSLPHTSLSGKIGRASCRERV